MSLYSTGTATFTTASTNVVGIGTAWTTSMVGAGILRNDAMRYIVAVISPTQLTLNRAASAAMNGTGTYDIDINTSDSATAQSIRDNVASLLLSFISVQGAAMNALLASTAYSRGLWDNTDGAAYLTDLKAVGYVAQTPTAPEQAFALANLGITADIAATRIQGRLSGTTLVNMKAIVPVNNTTAQLVVAGREGWFTFKTGDYTTLIANDPVGGIYVKADTIAANLGAWIRQNNSPANAAWFGANGTLTPDNKAGIDAALAHLKTVGGELYLPSGNYFTSAEIVFNQNHITGMPVDDPRQVDIRGEGQGNTVFSRSTGTGYVLNLQGGTGIAAHTHTTIGDFSVRAGTGRSGMVIFNRAFQTLKNMVIATGNTGLTLESVLSSRFENLSVSACNVGVSASAGGGFSNCNANGWYNCNIGSNTTVGYSGGPHSGLDMFGCNFEGNGTHAAINNGAMNVNFSGGEGCVGLNMSGGYFENNAGDWDINITNTGTREVVHTITGVNFNRISNTRFTKNNIKITGNASGGRNKLILIGCSFNGFATYVADTLRQYVLADQYSEVFYIGCTFGSAVEAVGCVNNGNPLRTVALLPAASANNGQKYDVSDSSVTTFWGVVAAGGTNRMTVKSDGTNWRVVG